MLIPTVSRESMCEDHAHQSVLRLFKQMFRWDPRAMGRLSFRVYTNIVNILVLITKIHCTWGQCRKNSLIKMSFDMVHPILRECFAVISIQPHRSLWTTSRQVQYVWFCLLLTPSTLLQQGSCMVMADLMAQLQRSSEHSLKHRPQFIAACTCKLSMLKMSHECKNSGISSRCLRCPQLNHACCRPCWI